jgi:putative lipoic acid-binding regulatory protein
MNNQPPNNGSGNQEAPKIEFPCENYPIKILGESTPEMHAFVLATTEKFAPGFDQSKVTIKESAKGRFQSITVFITATGIDQLQAYHQTLVAHPAIKMVM